MDDTDRRFPIAFTGPEMKDLRLSVKCKPVSGRWTRGAAWCSDSRTRTTITSFAGWNGKVASVVWHDLAVEAKGDTTAG